jgi:S-formylglutathione hydrolase FrmB
LGIVAAVVLGVFPSSLHGSEAFQAVGPDSELVNAADAQPAVAGTVPALATTRTSFGCSERIVTSVVEVPDATAVGGTREVRIYRPPGPDSRRLPVLYLLHGLPGQDDDFARTGLVEQMDGRLCAGERFVAAVPDGNVAMTDSDGAYDTEWADDPEGRFDLESFVTGPLVRAVEGNLTRPAALRAIGGFSMGGFAAASIALRHPTTYRTILAFAGYFDIDDPDHALGNTATAQSHHSPDKLIHQAKGMHIYLADGRSDTLRVVEGQSQDYAERLRVQHDDVRLAIVNGTHALSTFAAALPGALTFWRSRLPADAG